MVLAIAAGWLCSQLKRSLSSPSGARFILLSTNAGVLVGCAGRSADRLRGLGASLSLRCVRLRCCCACSERLLIARKVSMSAGLRCFADCRGLGVLGFRGRAAPPRWVFLGKAAPGFAGGLLRRWRVLRPIYSPRKGGGPYPSDAPQCVAVTEGLHRLRLDALREESLSDVPHEPRSSSLREGRGLGEGQESLWPFRFCEQAGVLDFGV